VNRKYAADMGNQPKKVNRPIISAKVESVVESKGIFKEYYSPERRKIHLKQHEVPFF
jgi:hypothetical protein